MTSLMENKFMQRPPIVGSLLAERTIRNYVGFVDMDFAKDSIVKTK
jgi:hypothetical protein